MHTPAYIRDPQIQPLQQLLQEIAGGLVRIPKFQRPVVWTDDQRLELIRSVCTGVPIGSIMLWRTSIDLATFDRLGPLVIPDTKSEFISYVLDGHQRLSTLAGALLGDPGEQVPSSEEEDTVWEILYDLEDEEFLMADRRVDAKPYFSLRLALDSVARMRFQRDLAERDDADELVERSERIAGAIYEFKVPILPVVTDEVDQATRIFQRVNSTGTDMSPVHMIHALTWNSSFSLNEKLAELREDVFGDKSWRGSDETLDQTMISACKAALGLDIYEGDIATVTKKLAGNQEILDDSALHIAAAIDFLAEHCHINSFKLLPYTVLLAMLAEGLRHQPQESEERDGKLRYWLWWTLYVEFAGGSNASRVRRATQNIQALFTERHEAKTTMPPAPDIAALPARFDFRHARAKMIALRLAEWQAAHASKSESSEVLNSRDVEAVQPLVTRSLLSHHQGANKDRLSKWLSSPANRLIAPSENTRALRDRLLAKPSPEERLAYLVPEAPAPEKADAEGWIQFFQERRRLLVALEYRFAHEQGLLAARPEQLDGLDRFVESFEGERGDLSRPTES